MKIIEDIIPKSDQDNIEKILLGNTFPLFLNSKTVNIDHKTGFQDCRTRDGIMFNHYFIRNGELVSPQWWKIIEPIAILLVKKFNVPAKITSCKLNTSFPNINFTHNNYYPPHFDTPDNAIVAIYYVNDADGDTIIFNNQIRNDIYSIENTISPKKGRVLLFNSDQLHSNYPLKSLLIVVLSTSTFY